MKKIIEFCDRHSSAIQAISTILLVMVTVSYAVSSRRTVNIMKDESDTSNRPYVGIISETYARKDYRLQFMPQIVNAGSVSAEITKIETDILDSKYLFNTIILLPKQERTPLIEINKPDTNKDLSFVIRIRYSNLINEKEKYCILYNYEIDGGVAEKIYLKSSEYCK